jgi:hypothetical protein
MTSNDFFSFFDFNLHPIQTLNQKTNPKQTHPNRPTLLLVDEKPPQKAPLKDTQNAFLHKKTTEQNNNHTKRQKRNKPKPHQ